LSDKLTNLAVTSSEILAIAAESDSVLAKAMPLKAKEQQIANAVILINA